MKKIIQTILLGCLPWALSAQLFSDGGTLQLDAGAVLFVDGDVTNTGTGQLTNQGELTVWNLTNDATLQGNGTYHVSGNWTNSGSFTGQSAVLFTGSGNSMVQSGGSAFYVLHMRKDNANLVLSDDLSVDNYMGFIEPNNKVVLAGKQFFLGSGVNLEGANNTSYFVTGNDGILWKGNVGTSQFVFPVGFDASSYNPLTISQQGTADALGVRCLEHMYVDGTSGAHITTNVVDASWVISEGTPSDNNLDIFANWSASDELGFDRNNCAIGHFYINGWDYGTSPGSPASDGGGFYYIGRNGLNNVGSFGVRSGSALTATDELVAASPKLGLFPNPTTNLLNVEFDVAGDYSFRVFDENGRFVLSGENVKTLDVSGLPAGMYALLATSEAGEVYQRFIVGK